MKQKTRIKIAFDMCVQQKFSFRMSVLLMAVTLVMLGIIVFQYRYSFNYRMKVQEGLAPDIDEIYFLCVGGNASDEEISKTFSEIKGIGSVYSYDNSYLTAECLSFLNEVQEGHKSDNTMTSIEAYSLYSYDFDIYNIQLTEGIAPKDIEWINEALVPLYLSEKYKGITNIGEHYYYYYDEETLIYDYYVAGYFSEDSTIVCESAVASDLQDGSYSLEYGVVELFRMGCRNISGGYFTINDGYSFSEISEEFQKKFSEIECVCSIDNVSRSISYMERDTVRSLRYLIIATILLSGTSIIVLLVIQISNVLTRSEEYGIWLTNKATGKDVVWMLLWQNIIRFIFAGLIAFLGVNLYIRKFLFSEIIPNSVIAHRISNRIIISSVYPSMAALGIFIVICSSFVPIIKLAKAEPVKLIKGDM